MTAVLEMLRQAPSSVLPDPKVAAILYDEHGHAIAKYSKQRFGEPHSEAQVLLRALARTLQSSAHRLSPTNRVRARNHIVAFRRRLFTPRSIRADADLTDVRELVRLLGDPFRRASLFVNLEPCSHFGKNPACAALISAAGIKSVVFSHYDSDPDVCGRGERMLRNVGVRVTRGLLHTDLLAENHLFCKISYFMPKLFGGIHPTAAATNRPPLTMLGLLVPKSEVRTRDLGRTIHIHTFGVPPLRHTAEHLRTGGRPRISQRRLQETPRNPDTVLFTTLLNPLAILAMIADRFGCVPGAIISAAPDMGFELGKEECIEIIRDYCPDTHVCVGVRMAPIKDKLARISLRRRLSVGRERAGTVAIVVLAKGVPPDRTGRIETRFMDLVGATTLHVSRLEEYLVMLRFLRDDVDVSVYLGGDLFASRWKERTLANLQKLVERARNVEVCCTEEEVVDALREAGVPRIRYLEPYWEIIL